MKRVVWLACVVFGLAAFWVVSTTIASDGAKPRPEGDFAPKVLMIYTKDPDKGAVLGDVSLRQLGNRTFIKGKVMTRDGSESPWTSATQWIAIDEVVAMFEFNSVEDARKADQASNKNEDKP
ncbi:MAG TPA: hypothetical protein VKD72_33145 [Gemmataceae bacterium]|nr:hypothetical protein [Gemmataceae bacterium]